MLKDPTSGAEGYGSSTSDAPPSASGPDEPAAPPAPDAGARGSGTSGKSQADRPSMLPALSLPKGGGAIRGMGEKFAVAAATGTASLSVPLPASPGRAGFGPQVGLGYDSGHGNGPFGLGFALSLPTITRKTDKGLPRYYDVEESDEYILSGAEDLVPKRVANPADPAGPLVLDVQVLADRTVQSYRPRVEGLFARIERHTLNAGGAEHWEVTTKDNGTHIYGQTTSTQIVDPKDPSRVFSWLLEQSSDDRGNVVQYVYKAEDGAGVDPTQTNERSRFDYTASPPTFVATAQRYLQRVFYGNLTPGQISPTTAFFELVFDYGEHSGPTPTPDEDVPWPVRVDPFSSYRAGFEVRTYRLCQRVLMFHHLTPTSALLVRSTDLTYEPGPAFTYLTGITQFGYLFDDATGALVEKAAMPTLALDYARPVVNDVLSALPPESLDGLAGGVDGAHKQWVDLDGEGIPGVLIDDDRGWYYKSNAGGGELTPPVTLPTLPSPSTLAGGMQQLIDLGGDGQLDLVSYGEPVTGYATRTTDGDFDPFRTFPALPNVDWHDPNLRFIDLDGDGLPDLLISEDDAFIWYHSLAKDGFEPAQRIYHPSDDNQGAAIVFADPEETVQLADMSGDGMVDIVRVRNGEVAYWPNLGYGRFGAKVTLASSPVFAGQDEFDARRIRFADVDGSGTTDIFYLGTRGVTLYFNQSGNALRPATPITSLPPMDSAGQVSVVDLLGTGTATLVWSSPLQNADGRQILYVDLMNSVKPHLMVSVVNNLGATTQVTYAPSTKFYLADKAAGTPWLTRLMYPVQVVAQIDRLDAISNSHLTSTYTYHHGFFDGVEREFRGFARVEQTDAEAFTVGTAGTETFQPPTRTVSWFHTGAWLEKETLEAALALEYFPPGPKDTSSPSTMLLPDTILTVAPATPPATPRLMTIQDEREAARALRGHMLHQEVYADDADTNPTLASLPFATTEASFEVQMLQTSAGWRHGVFYAFPRETISVHTERNPTDPRVTHELVLDIDEFGNVLRKAAVAYGRGTVAGAQPEQQKVWATYAQMSYINHPVNLGTESFYRLGLPSETISYELTGLDVPVGGQGLVTRDAINGAITGLDAAHDIPYDATPPADGQPARRMLDHKQQLYYAEDATGNPTGAAALGDTGAHALPFESYQLALTAGLVAELIQQSGDLCGTAFDPAVLLSEGRYVQRDTGYWTASGHLVFDSAHFYLPTEAFDAFGQHHFATFDTLSLLIEATQDPLGNIVLAVNDYRVLVPSQLTDPNLNRVAVAFDALGMVVKTVVMGKVGAGEGDTLDQPTATVEYDLLRWQNPDSTGVPRPALAHSISRERHGDPNSPVQHTYTYSDGFGRVVMHKVQAEPGDVPGVGTVATRWVGTGRVVLNNKDNPVKHYEPFFSATPEFEDESVVVESGVTPIIHYDALDRIVHTELPNGTDSRVEFDAWQQVSSDPNDTVLESAWYASRGRPPASGPQPTGDPEQRAAWLAARHANTPTVSQYDGLGRLFLLVAQDRTYQDDGTFTDAFHETRTALDITGNALSLIDARQALASLDTGNPPIVTFQQRFDVISRRQRLDSADAGVRLSVTDVTGKPLRRWDSRGQIFRYVYDELQRQNHLFVQQTVLEQLGQDLTERLLLRTVFGEALDPPVPAGPPPLIPPAPSPAQQLNLRGQPYRLYDCAGVISNLTFDFKANLLDSERRLAADYHVEPNWLALASLTDPTQIQTAAEQLLDPVATSPLTVFTTHSEFDALNRVTSHTTPDGSVAIPTYNQASFLEQLSVGAAGGAQQLVIANIDYNARGQRVLYAYQNPLASGAAISCQVNYTYDPFTFRLSNVLTTRTSDGTNLQDLLYTCDPVGNIVEIDENATTTPVIFTTTPVTGNALYRFDSLYRLIQSEGREHPGQTGTSTQPSDVDIPVGTIPHPNDLQALVRYLERYSYDPVGNIQSIAHTTTAPGGGPGPSQTQWTRQYEYAVDSNRLLGASVPGDAPGSFGEVFNPDPHGSMREMLHLHEIDWDYADRMQHVNQLGGGDVYFTYDGSGQRVRKVWEHSGLIEERIYIGEWEIYRRHSAGTLVLERGTLHVMDGERRVAMVETKTVDTVDGGTGIARWRFQLDNHLGSSILELTETGDVISYEEYHPFGSTAFHTAAGAAEVSAKRYRYTGKERDEETGLYYYGARYYAPWLGRWTAADPSGMVDGPNLFAYARNQPVVLVDPNGREAGAAFGVNPLIIKQQRYTGAETQERIRRDYAKVKVHYRGDAVWNEKAHSWFVDRSQRIDAAPKTPANTGTGTPRTAPGGSGGSQSPKDSGASGGTGPSPTPPPESTPPPSTAPAPTPADPNRPATAGEAAKAFAVGAVEGAAIGVALVALGPVGAAIGVGLLAYGLFKLATGGYKEVAASAGRLATGEGTAADYKALGGIVGGIAAGGAAGILEGGTAGVEGGVGGAEETAAGSVGDAASSAKAGTFPENPADLLPEVPRVVKPSGTQVIQPSETIRIRAEQHALKPGETFSPRHHGQHYHVEIRLDPSKSWNNSANVVKVKPPGYVPGQGTGFLPGEKIPGK
jgi:RHS repeat-associated protein